MYMFFWFFKQLYYCLRRIFKSGILFLIVFFIAFLFIFVKPSFAFSQEDLTYSGFSSSQMNDIYNFIEENKGNYDSVICAYSCNPNTGNEALNFVFYNYSVNGKLYKTLNNYSANQYNIYSQYSSTNSVMSLATHLDMTPYSTTPNYTNNVYRAITNIRTGSVSDYVANYNLPCAFATNRDIYTDNSFSSLWFRASNESLASLNPTIVNTTSSIENWSFDNLTINCGQINPNSTFYLHCDYEGYTFSYDNLEQYKTINNGVAYLYIPKSLLNQSIVLRNGFNFSFGLQARQPNMQVLYYELGSYTMNLTTEEQQQINEDSDKQVLSDISNNQKETTQAVENLENTITNTNIDDSSVNLPTDNTNDITQDGLNNIFTSIYNAFCVGEPQNIVFPIPFTNKNITLQPNYIRQMLTDSGANWVITIIEAFWWYLISRFIIKDVSKKITKIKSGNVENIENSNIKEEML